jgi:pantothenate kinase-related protein Tda10
VDRPGLVKVPGKDVVVVANGDDGLEDEQSLTGDSGTTGWSVGVLPQDPIVLFVTADDVLDDSAFAGRVDLGPVKVLRVSNASSE